MKNSILLRWLSQVCFAAVLVFSFTGSSKAASFDLLELYWASSSTGNIDIDLPLSDVSPGTPARFTSNPDNATFVNSLSSGVLYGKITCANTFFCGANGSTGYFARRAPTGNSTISAVTFVLDPGTALYNSYGPYVLVVIGDAATYDAAYQSFGTVATSANADGAAIAGQLDSYFAHIATVSSPTVIEGNDLVHTVTLSGAALGTEVINFTRSHTTTSDADLGSPSFSNGVTLSNGLLSVPSGVTSFTVTYPSIDDSDIESDESYSLSVGGIASSGTITDNDSTPSVTISTVGDATEAEGTALAHLVTLSGPTAAPQTFPLTLTDGTTTAADYGSFSFSDGVTLSGSTLSVPAGVSSFTLTLAGAEDELVEGAEGYTLAIDGVQSAGTINDNDSAGLTAVKTVALTDLDTIAGPSIGDTLTWTVTVTNTGTVALSDVTISADTMTRADSTVIAGFGAASFSPASVASLAASAQTSFTASYTLTAEDVDAGGLSNTATVAATHSGGTPISDVSDDGDDGDGNTDDDATDYSFTATPGIALVKTATLKDEDGTPGVSVGDTIEYAFTVINTGAVTLSNVTVTDPKVTVAGGPLASLAAGATDSTTFTASYTLTQADLDAGGVTNTATVTAQPPTGSAITDTSGTAPDNDSATVTPLSAAPGIALVKTATLKDDDGTPGVSVGDTIEYAFTVINTGAVTLSNVTVTDPKVTVAGGPLASLAAGATDSTTFTASHTLTQADLDAGGVTNTATVSGQPPSGSAITDTSGTAPDNDSATVTPLSAAPGIALVKTATLKDDDGTPGVSVGDTIEYAFTVINTGAVTLSNVTVTDPKVTVAGGPLASLAAGATDSTTFTASHTLTQADLDAGGVTNTATVSGQPPSGSAITDTSGTAPDNDSATVTPLAAAPGIALVKTATLKDDDGTPGVSVGDTIEYSFTVINTGTVTLSNVTVTDPKVTVAGGPLVSLAAGATDSATFTASYTLTQADLDAGGVTNTATVSGQPPSGSAITDTSGTAPDNDSATVTPLAAAPGIALVKTATLKDDDGTPGVSVGDTIEYSFTVINTGTVTLSNVTVTDPKVTVAGGPLVSLAAGATDSATFTASDTLTQADLDAGGVTNTATVTAQPPTGSAITDTSGTAPDNDTATVTPLAAAPGIALVKTATLKDDDGTPGVSVGDTIEYAFTVINTGAVTLSNITVTDPMLGGAVGTTLAALAPGADSGTHFTARYAVTAADVSTGFVTNQATAEAAPASGAAISDLSGITRDDDTQTVTFLGSIAGKVADATGARDGAIVRLTDPATGMMVAETTTDAQGNYAFIGLEAGSFCISFVHAESEAVVSITGTAENGRSAGDQVCGLDIVPGAGRTITGVDAVMVDPSGVIYDAVTRTPLAGATVTLLHNGTPVPNSWLAATGDSNNKVTGSDGRYSFLLQSPAQSGIYTLQVSATDYENSTLIPAQPGAMTPAIGLGVEAVVAANNAPAAGGDTTYYTAFNMSFPDWSDATTLSKGIIHNHIPLDPVGVTTELSLTKTADVAGLSTPAQVGDVIRYTITARNNGALPITGVSLEDPLTTDEALTTSAETADGTLDPGESWVWTASITLDAQTVTQDQITNLATLSATDAWGQPLTLESSPDGNTNLGSGNGIATVVTLQGLIDEIRPELEDILRDDLTQTLDRLGRSFSGFARDAARRLRAGAPEGCLNNETADNDLNLKLNDAGLRADGSLGKEVYDCTRREWRIDSFEASTLQDDIAGNQTLLSYTRRVERLKGDDRIAGRFWGAYASHSDIATGTANGSIHGLGVFGGLYGARKLPGEGMFDYYLGGAVGRHSFTFDFPQTVTITAKGSYTYAAVLAGAGLSRSYAWQDMIVTPRLGIDLAYAPGAQVSVEATQGLTRDSGRFDLGATGSWRLFLESEFRNDLTLAGDGKGLFDGLASELTLTPALLCDGDFEGPADCGFGLALGLSGHSADGLESWSAEIDASATEAERRLALKLAYARRIEALKATLRTGLSASVQGDIAASVTLQSRF